MSRFGDENPDIISQGLEAARGAMFMGFLLDELTRDELLAVAALGWRAFRKEQQSHLRELEPLS